MERRFRILVADKNKNVRDFLMRELSAEGYETASTRDGAFLLEIIAGEDPPDLLILDLEIPGIDSAGIFGKTQAHHPPIPVIVHTFLTEECERAAMAETEIYIEKSGNIDHLKSAVADMLKKFYPERF